jgi:hypothetical protein
VTPALCEGCEVRKAAAWRGAMATQAFELHPSIQPSDFILALPPGGALGGGEKSGKRSFIAIIRSFEPTPERNPMAQGASAQRF